jgi:uncharacterized protein (TIGR03083 family)
MDWLPGDRYADELEAETERLIRAVSRQNPTAQVPTCPEWTVRDLVTHVGTGHRLASEIIETRRDRMLPYVLVAAPEKPDEWGAWLTAGARRLNAAVRERGFDGWAWTWQPRYQTAGFWLRRMVHDELVHRFDADPDGEVAPDLAADGVSDLLLALSIFDRLKGDGETLRFTATDVGVNWLVTLTPTGLTYEHGITDGKADLEGAAKDLLLILNRRREATKPDKTLETFLANAKF